MGKKTPEALLQMTARFKKRGVTFWRKKNAGGLTEDDDQVLKMSRTPCPVEDPKS